jgi:biopolymer transport protein ExbB
MVRAGVPLVRPSGSRRAGHLRRASCAAVGVVVAVLAAATFRPSPAFAQQSGDPPPAATTDGAAQGTPGNGAASDGKDAAPPKRTGSRLGFRELMEAAGSIGMVIVGLSVAAVALVVEHLLSIRRGTLMPAGLAETVHELISKRQLKAAEQACREQPSFLAYVLGAGLSEVGAGWHAVEKAMEDAAASQTARLLRKIDYLQVIATLAPMLGLLGTVWGMIEAFMEFETKANPQVSELAPGIYKALVTTVQGLVVAIPALGIYAAFRNRIDELVAEAAHMAEHVFSSYKKSLHARRRAQRKGSVPRAGTARPATSGPAAGPTGTSDA